MVTVYVIYWSMSFTVLIKKRCKTGYIEITGAMQCGVVALCLCGSELAWKCSWFLVGWRRHRVVFHLVPEGSCVRDGWRPL